jgi:cystathionine beta-lyase
MTTVSLGSVRLVVDHRRIGGLGGPSLRVLEAAPRDRELLRFDCFDEGAHWHLDPAGRDLVTPLEPGVDPLEWTLGELRRDLAGYLARAAPELAAPDPASSAMALDTAESALRNPPVDLDAVRPELRRPSCGEKWTHYPEDVLPLWVADMDFPIAEPIRRVLRFAVDRSDLGYPIHPAPTDVPEITASHMHDRFGWLPDPGCVEILSDVVQGMYVAVQQFSEPGDGVVVQTPIYPPFLGCARALKRRLVENPLASGPSGPGVDTEALRAAVDDHTRVILLCNPHNPTGRVFRREELEGVAKLALERDLVVVSDEIHADLVYSGHRHVPFASLSPEVEARTITLSAASKAFNVAGLRCAVVIFGSAELKRRFNQLPRHLRGGVSLPGIEALRAAWRHGRPWLDQVLAHLERNRDRVTAFVRDELSGIRLHPPEATYLAWLDCRDLALEPSPYEFFLRRARVALSDGPTFGASGRGFVRINFATSRTILDDALGRMASALREDGAAR